MNKIYISMNIGAKLKEARKLARLSQLEVSKALHVTEQCISSWERDRTVPSPEMLEKLASTYGCTVDTLTEDASTGQLSLLHIEELMLNLDDKGIDRVIAYGQYLKTRHKA